LARDRADPRLIAWNVLCAVERGAFADAELARPLRGESLDERDRGLATQLVYGTLAWQGLCDHVLGALGRPAARLDPEVRTLLRMALYQMTKLERIPEFAAVDTAVELAKRHKRGAAGLVNALLRAFLRSGKDLHLPAADGTAARLAVAGSHPRWLVERWISLLGAAETAALLDADNRPAPTVLRVNRRRADRDTAVAALAREPCAARACHYAADAIEIELRGAIDGLAAYRDGLVTAQGEASQLVGAMIPAAATRVLDTCAAPGGKATLIAERTDARVVAVDQARSGIVAVARQAARLGVAVAAIRADARVLPLRPRAYFDAVLVDAPCTGLGTLRQHPEIRWRRQPRDVARLAAIQAAILEAAAAHVDRNGVLVYATCTLLPEENEQRVADFLARNPDFDVDDPRPDLPVPARQLIGEDLFLRTWPHHHGLDGFFAARLRRR
jgi:16S rRNA (cytosine967-C5)-methyltransferase